MDRSELTRRLMATFLDELDEHVATLNRDLLALEKSSSTEEGGELLQSLFRAAHSLKGASRAVGVEVIEQACHALEDMLAPVRDGEVQPGGALFSLVFKVADAIEEAGMRLREEQDLTSAPLSQLLPALQTFEHGQAADESSADESSAGEASVAEASVGEASVAEASVGEASVGEASVGEARADEARADEARVVPASAKPAEPSPAAGPPPAADRTAIAVPSVRVAADKLDALLAQAGELLVARQRIELGVEQLESLRESVTLWRHERRSVEAALRRTARAGDREQAGLHHAALDSIREQDKRIREFERDLDRLVGRARFNAQYLGQVGAAIEDDVQRARMLPLAEACTGLERAIRDVAASTGKQAWLQLIGADVQVDRSVLEGLKDPLLHLVRNAVDHGLESPAQRRAAGKPEKGTITVHAELTGGRVEVRIRDDGRGIDLQRVAEKAAQRGLTVPQAPDELARLIFLPAFSTAASVSEVSGRGVGLDVVHAEMERLHGAVDVSFQPGQGTCFTLTAPLTLTTIRAVLVEADGQIFAIPTSSVFRVVRFGAEDRSMVAGRSVLTATGSPVALAGLGHCLALSDWSLPKDEKAPAVVVAAGRQQVALAVDAIHSEVELTVKTLGPRVRRMKHVMGATLLPSGELALVLNVSNLVRSASEAAATLPAMRPRQASDKQPRLLVVDDSVTSRTLLKTILSGAGYEVEVAVDGQQALELLGNAEIDLVVSDVDMPRVDGFALARAVRRLPGRSDLPLVLVTGRGDQRDRQAGLDAGANAYIVKSGFDQTRLLHVISELL